MPKTTKKKRVVPRDIGRLKELLEVVSRGKYMWETTFDAIQDPVLIISKEYRIERANLVAAQRAHHKDIRELIGKYCYESFAGRPQVCPHCPLKKTLGSKKRVTVEIPQMREDGDFQVNSYPLVQDLRAGRYHVVHHYRDITEERNLQRRLIQSEKMAAIGLLAGGVAHEVNNPLSGILAFTQLLKRELPAEGRVQSDLSEIESAARRCKKIVEDLLTFSRPSKGEREKLDIHEVIEKVLTMVRVHLRHQNISVVTEFAPSMHPVIGEAVRLQQVFLNLMTNAGQSMPEGGEVRVRTKNSGLRVTVEIIDQGTGIAAQDLPKIFDPFFTTKQKGEGIGLGLSICQSIIHDHSGKIEVESAIGRGSTFRVILPVARGAEDRCRR